MADIVPGRATGGPIEDFTQTRKREEELARKKKQQEDAIKRQQQQQAIVSEKKRKANLDARTINPVEPLQGFVQTITGTGKAAEAGPYVPVLSEVAGAAREAKKAIIKGGASVAEGVLNVGTQVLFDLTVNQNKEKEDRKSTRLNSSHRT